MFAGVNVFLNTSSLFCELPPRKEYVQARIYLDLIFCNQSFVATLQNHVILNFSFLWLALDVKPWLSDMNSVEYWELSISANMAVATQRMVMGYIPESRSFMA
jgi:hypothetical protein